MHLDGSDLAKIIGAAIGLLYALVDWLRKEAKKAQENKPAPKSPVRPPPPVARRAPAPRPAPAPVARAAVSPAPTAARKSAPEDAARQKLADAVTTLEREAKELGESVRRERATERFLHVLTEWLPEQAQSVRERALKPPDNTPASTTRALLQHANWLMMVLEEVRSLVRQRRDKTLLVELGDADAIAEACYEPIITFARTKGLPLRTARPVAQLTDFDMGIWTGFAPTSLAPIFLPLDFFQRAAWWPALGHEIGHDFLISIPGLRDRLGADLGLPNQSAGSIPLQLRPDVGLPQSELWRIHGGWFEELFCDVFGTMMCGPAFAETMVQLFSCRENPVEVLAAGYDGSSRRYDPHPPRHLRVHAAAVILERGGFHEDAKRILSEWHQRNGIDPDPANVGIPFFAAGRWISVPFAAVFAYTRALVERLYAGPLPSLEGFGLESISGLDYGPHEHNEAIRAKGALLAGRVPAVRDPRAVISGAVLAAREQPQNEATILACARRAIAAVGTTERAPDAFTPESAPAFAGAGALELSPLAVREAFLLGEVLRRPGAGGRNRRAA